MILNEFKTIHELHRAYRLPPAGDDDDDDDDPFFGDADDEGDEGEEGGGRLTAPPSNGDFGDGGALNFLSLSSRRSFSICFTFSRRSLIMSSLSFASFFAISSG